MVATTVPPVEDSVVSFECRLHVAPEAPVLAAWYAAHSQVRRLWAIDEVDSILIVMKVEPTLDGHDALPLWLANRAEWSAELTSALSRRVHLELLGFRSRADALSVTNEALIAEVSWREEYCE